MIKIIKNLISNLIPYFLLYKKFCKSNIQVSYFDLLKFKMGLLRKNRYWPKHKNCVAANPGSVYVGINCIIGRPGNYIQGSGKIYFGDYVQLAPNVGILSSNHDLYDQRKSNKEFVKIGDYSWVGMNSVVLPGVELGTRTIVAAGSVVTKSFPDGFCVLAGVPAKVIKLLDKDKFTPWKDEYEFYGFIPKEEFEKSNFYKKNYK